MQYLYPKAKSFADKLHTDAISDDYTKMCLPWEQMTRTTNWIYYTGLVFDAFLQTDFDKYHGFMKDFYNQYITDDGKIKTYCTGELDSAMLGAALVEILEKGDLTKTEKERYTNGICYIYNTLQKQTSYPQAGNLWLHSQNADGTPKTAWTKWNICLDGIYMSQIFLIRLTEAIDKGVVSILKVDGSVVTSDELWKDLLPSFFCCRKLQGRRNRASLPRLLCRNQRKQRCLLVERHWLVYNGTS